MPIVGAKPHLIPPLDESLDDPQWTTAQPFAWQSRTGKIYVVPADATGNLASVPRWLPAMFAVFGARAHMASFIHDVLYDRGYGLNMIDSREEADAVWLEIAEETRVDPKARMLMWKGIRLFGESHFNGPPDPREPDEYDWNHD